MAVLMLGATGRTGRLLAHDLLAAGTELTVLVRDPAKLDLPSDHVRVVLGSATHSAAIADGLMGVTAVISALGPGKGETQLHQRAAAILVAEMSKAGVARFVGISGAAVTLPGDIRTTADQAIGAVVRRIGGAYAADKAEEARIVAASDLQWTLVRPGRLTDGAATGRVKSAAHTPRGWRITRADLAAFITGELAEGQYLQAAPFVAN